MTALVSYPRALAAELVRTKHSASARFAGVGLAVAILQGLAWSTVATRELRGWEQLVGWQALYITALFTPLTALLVALTVERERKAREGGTLWRPLTPRVAFAARATVLTLQLLVFNAALILPMLLIGLAHGLADPPIVRIFALWLVLWLCSLLVAAIFLLLTRVAGLYVTLGLALGWQLAGTLTAETASGAWQPWAWQVRAALPLVGIHANGTALEPHSPIWDWNPLWPTLYSLSLALVIAGVGALLSNRDLRILRRRPRPSASPVSSGPARQRAGGAQRSVAVMPLDRRMPPGRPHRLAAVAGSLRRTGLASLTVSALGTLVLIGLVWNTSYVRGFATWVAVPLGTCLFACLAWTAQRDAWRVLALRASPARLAAHLLAVGTTVLLLVGLTTATITATRGDTGFARFGTALVYVGFAWLLVSLWLTARYGAGATIGVTLVVLVFSLVFGGTEFANSNLWLLGVLGWPASATTWPRIAVSLVLSAVISTAAGTAWLRALRAAAARSTST